MRGRAAIKATAAKIRKRMMSSQPPQPSTYSTSDHNRSCFQCLDIFRVVPSVPTLTLTGFAEIFTRARLHARDGKTGTTRLVKLNHQYERQAAVIRDRSIRMILDRIGAKNKPKVVASARVFASTDDAIC